MDYLNYGKSDDKIYGNLEDHTNILFYSPIWWFEQPLPPKAYEWAFWLKEQTYEHRVQKSNRGGFQSPGLKWKDFEFRDHVQNILYEFKEFENFKFNNWWLNINEKGDYNNKHVHPGSELSGIWYITDNEGLLKFEDPHVMTRDRIISKVFGNDTCLQVKCLAGDLVLFPSDMQHSVLKHTLDTPRISVSFNMSYKD